MGACGSKHAPNVEAVAQDAEQGKAAPSAAAPAAEGGPCVFEGMQPAGINARLSQGALSPEDLEIQRTELKEAAKLIDSMGARGEEAAILAPAEKDGCKYELAINWESSHVALVTQKMQAVPLSAAYFQGAASVEAKEGGGLQPWRLPHQAHHHFPSPVRPHPAHPTPPLSVGAVPIRVGRPY